MIRLFVGLRPPRGLRAHLIAGMGGIAGARWQNDNQLHLSLRFIGEVDRHQLQDIVAALGNVRARPFLLHTDSPGSFDQRQRVQALWLGVRPVGEVAALHKAVSRALENVGIKPEHRAFLPHVTLARFGRGAPSAFGQSPVLAVPGLEWPVDHFCLFESILTPDGSVYHVLERFPLQG